MQAGIVYKKLIGVCTELAFSEGTMNRVKAGDYIKIIYPTQTNSTS
ncbi:MAG: hypothetical protein ACJA2Q_002416 [Pseudohongiellaceae bacterium]|jgi:hypothetical protein